MIVCDCLDGLIASKRIGGKRFRNAVGKRIRYAGVYGSKKYRSGFILGRYFFVPMRRQNSESRNTDIAK